MAVTDVRGLLDHVEVVAKPLDGGSSNGDRPLNRVSIPSRHCPPPPRHTQGEHRVQVGSTQLSAVRVSRLQA